MGYKIIREFKCDACGYKDATDSTTEEEKTPESLDFHKITIDDKDTIYLCKNCFRQFTLLYLRGGYTHD